jgi:uncharacterized phage protein gp47/JayE
MGAKIMPLETVSVQTIYDRMKADFDQKMGQSNWLTRSFALILIAVFAGAISLQYLFLNNLFLQLLPTSANLEWFTRHARFYGMPQIVATPAQYTYVFTGVNTTVIPADTLVENDAGVEFFTDALATIASGSATVGITARVSGTGGNIDMTGSATVTLTLVTSIPNIDDEGTVTAQTQIATDSETLDAWKSRLLQRIQNPPSSGNKTDYQRWALQGGADRAWIYAAEEWQGPGTVGVVVATKALEAVSSTVKTAIETIIEASRPVSASYTISDPVIKQITLDISLNPNTAYFQGEVDDALDEMFLTQSEPGGTLLLSQLNKSVANTGVDDYEITDIEEDGISIGVADIEQSGIGLSRYNGSTYALKS